jgi:hypothetical protein
MEEQSQSDIPFPSKAPVCRQGLERTDESDARPGRLPWDANGNDWISLRIQGVPEPVGTLLLGRQA